MPVLEYILFTQAQIHIYTWTQDIHTTATQPSKLILKCPQNPTPENTHSKQTHKSKHKHLLAIPNKNPTFEIQTQTKTQISKHTDQKGGSFE